jgi:transcriptional regulator with XRE-family HTH domain
MKLAKAISRRIRDLREAAGLSQQDVAMRSDLSMSLVAKLEQGKKADPRASTLLALAKALAVPPGKLLEDLLPPVPANGAASVGEAQPKPDKKKKKKKKSKVDDLVLTEATPAPAPAPAPQVSTANPGEPAAEASADVGKKKKKNKGKHK